MDPLNKPEKAWTKTELAEALVERYPKHFGSLELTHVSAAILVSPNPLLTVASAEETCFSPKQVFQA